VFYLDTDFSEVQEDEEEDQEVTDQRQEEDRPGKEGQESLVRLASSSLYCVLYNFA
jgi:hypothetical protein